ncbi:MAG: adenylosuccinate lyase, partial [Nitrospinales bacterium]
MLNKMTSLVENLIVYPKNMQKNLEKTGGLIFSQNVLLALARKGLSREDAYRMVQRNAMQVWKKGGSFLSRLKRDKEIAKHLSARELDESFDLKQRLKNVDYIFNRVFG